MAVLPNKLLKITQTTLQTLATWDEFENGDMFTGFPYRWEIQLDVDPQIHSSPSSITPYQYDGLDIKVGDWVTTAEGGVAVRIYEIVSQTSIQAVVRVEDVDRFNIMSDFSFAGVGISADGQGYVFEVDEDGLPVLGPAGAFYLGVTLQTDLMARFSRRNAVKKYVKVEQTGHTLAVGDIIFLDDDGVYKAIEASEANKNKLDRIIGFVSEVGIPGVNFFAYTPRGQLRKNISPALPTGMLPGQIAYLDPVLPGKLTATKPQKNAVPVYIRLTDDTTGILINGGAGSGNSGPLGYYESSYVVADLTARDAIPVADLELGDSALVLDNGTGTWAYYKVSAKDTVTVPNTVTWLTITSEELLNADSSRIVSDSGNTRVETQENGDNGTITLVSKTKTVAEVVADDLAVGGEKLVVTNTANEVRLLSKDTSTTNDVDIRLVPQGDGHVFFGILGDGVVEAEKTFSLTVKGGDDDTVSGPGDLLVSGGNATSGDFDGGSVVIKPGEGFGTGEDGQVSVKDVYDTTIVEFKTAGSASSNWIEIANGASDIDVKINGVKVSVASGSTSANVDMFMAAKGAGLVRVDNYSNYMSSLNNTGTNDALVTKGYVLALAGLGENGEQQVIVAGAGLTEDNGTFNVNVGANTVGLDGVGNLIVKSSAVEGQILVSTGVAGEQAVWGGLNFSNTNSFTGVLTYTNGGTGFSTYAQGDILVGNAGGSLDKVALGSVNKALVSTGTALNYSYISALYDTEGLKAFEALGVVDAVNTLAAKSSITEAPVVLSATGTDTDISVLLEPKGNGLVLVPTGYTALVQDNDQALINKGYLDQALLAQTEPYYRYQLLDSNWSSEMEIGDVLPTVVGKQVYVEKVKLVVSTAVSGGGVSQARVQSGTDTLMEFNENDILTVGTYVADLDEMFASTNTQITIQFYAADGLTLATPTDGTVSVFVYYKFR